MRTVLFVVLLMLPLPTSSHAGELDLSAGLQANHSDWADDHGGGPTLAAAWLFKPWIGASFVGKEQYATVDDRYLSYFSLNAIVRKSLDHVRVSGTLGLVHQHEEPKPAIDAMPLESLFGVADGTRHRMASRAGIQLAFPFRDRARGDWYFALDLDATVFAEQERGPRWMSSAGLSIGFTHDFAKAVAR
jgi:hypothetical protein